MSTPRRRTVSAVLLAVSLAVLCALVGVTAGAGPASAFYRSPSCGGTTILKSDGTPWVCTFDDEFSSTTLDTTKWTAWNGVNYNTNPSVCYYSDAQHVYVRNGYLNLAVAPLSSPQTCITGSGTVQATYGGGLVHTLGHFSQTYGRFEARIKFGGGNGVHDDFWLYPTSNNYPGQAEIDVAEPFGSMPNTMSAVTHVTGADGKDDGAWAPCTLNSWASGFHTYTLVWTPTAITFSYDGVQCMNFTNWSTVAGYADPAPFNQPFFMILQTLVDGGDGLAAPDTTTTFPAVTQVDYVRAWK